jgi:hypothetical protein
MVMKKILPPSKRTTAFRAHKRDLLWQIFVPLGITVLIFVAASVGAATQTGATDSLWADISTIWLLIPVIFFAIIFLLLLVGIIYGVAKLLQITPIYTHQLYNLICMLGKKIEGLADETAKPIFFVEGISASIRRFFRQK